jgi:hypothetical protein
MKMRELTTSNITLEQFKKQNKTRGWALSAVGCVVYAVLRLCGLKPLDFYGVPYFEVGKNWGGLELGWFFICGEGSDEELKMHEVGHGIQNAVVGGLGMLCCSIGSALRYWKREIFGATTTYDSWWFEGNATALGREFINRIKGE